MGLIGRFDAGEVDLVDRAQAVGLHDLAGRPLMLGLELALVEEPNLVGVLGDEVEVMEDDNDGGGVG